MSIVTVNIPKIEKERLSKIALRYGLSLPELARRVLEEISSEIPNESFGEYKNSKQLRSSFNKALKDWESNHTTYKL
ncbi:MAG: hypothetical protein Q8L47_02280 [bacterium]|nr:hypothetical protein [bacterium]